MGRSTQGVTLINLDDGTRARRRRESAESDDENGNGNGNGATEHAASGDE